MPKTLRIFRKDIHHLWPEILLSLAFTACFAVTRHYAWPDFRPGRDLSQLTEWIENLLLLLWPIVMARLIQDESLVGDRQFWLTRPYGCTNILAAKLLFVALFLILPYIGAQLFVLHQAGLPLVLLLPELATRVGMLCLFGFLTVFALATLTSSPIRMFLYALGGLLFSVLILALSSVLRPDDPDRFDPGRANYFENLIWLIPIVCVAIIFLQYARRRTSASLTVLASTVILLAIAGAFPWHGHSPYVPVSANETTPVSITFDPDPKFQEFHAILSDEGKFGIELPLHLAGIALNRAIRIGQLKVVIDAPGVAPATITNSYFNPNSFASDRTSTLYLEVPGDVVRRSGGKPLSFHLSLAVDELQPQTSATVLAGAESFNIPGNGHCYQHGDAESAICLFAWNQPGLTRISWTTQPQCGVPSPQDKPRDIWSDRLYTRNQGNVLDSVLAYTRVFPIRARQISPTQYFCPNTPLTFTHYTIIRRRVLQLTLPPLDPQQYRSLHHDPDEDN